jgi:hypothetical protein
MITNRPSPFQGTFSILGSILNVSFGYMKRTAKKVNGLPESFSRLVNMNRSVGLLKSRFGCAMEIGST